MGEYFGTDGVHSEANKELMPELAFKLGRYEGYVLDQHEEEGKRLRVLVGRDTGISGQMLEEALISGLLSVGIEVFQLGMISTPGVAYLTCLQKTSAEVMVSASHNPAQDNGIKFFGAGGFKLVDDQELEIKALLGAEVDELPCPSAEGLGTIGEFPEGLLKCPQFSVQTINDDLSDLTICVDAANEATSTNVNRLFTDLEADFYTMGTDPDGLNINDGIGSVHPERPVGMVAEKRADAGLAFDDDGDRIITVDRLGNIVDGDKTMFICAKYLAEKNQLKRDTVVTTVMSNLRFHGAVEGVGLKDVVTQVGDCYVVEEMCKNDYDSGGEQSGHMIFLGFNTARDRMLSGIQLLNVMKQIGKKLSELAAGVTTYPRKLVNIRVSDKDSAMDIPAVRKVIEEAKARMEPEGRTLVRPPGIEPLLRVMAEAPTGEKVNYYVDKVAAVVKEEIGLD